MEKTLDARLGSAEVLGPQNNTDAVADDAFGHPDGVGVSQSIVVGNQVVDVGIVGFEVGQFSVDLKVVFHGGPVEVSGGAQAGPDPVLFGLKEVEFLFGADSIREFGAEFGSERGTAIEAELGELIGLGGEKCGVHGGPFREGPIERRAWWRTEGRFSHRRCRRG